MKITLKFSALSALCMALTACAGGYQPFVGSGTGPNRMIYTPVVALEYNYENIVGGNVNGGCIPRTSGVNLEKVGKKRAGGGGECGGFPLPKTWKPGMTVKVNWKVNPYPGWRPRAGTKGGMLNDDDYNTIVGYTENYSATVPLPPYDKVVDVAVHFLACNQIFIDYNTAEDRKAVKENFALYDASVKLCKPRPVVKSMADYQKKKAQMDKARQERKAIPQVILPNYIKRLEAEGKIPANNNKGK